MIKIDDIKWAMRDVSISMTFVGSFGSYNDMRRQAEKKTGNVAVAGKRNRMYVFDGSRWTHIAPPVLAKIMFSERFGLQQAVLAGTKTMTRRLVKCPRKFRGVEDVELEFHRRLDQDFYYDCVVVDGEGNTLGQLPLPYQVGQVVAVAQNYESLFNNPSDPLAKPLFRQYRNTPGWRNKMFVKPELMKNRIEITDLWFERLQDISDEDCLREGVHRADGGGYWIMGPAPLFGGRLFATPREAFACLIDKVCGRGTWEANPWVVVYSFKMS